MADGQSTLGGWPGMGGMARDEALARRDSSAGLAGRERNGREPKQAGAVGPAAQAARVRMGS